MILADTSVVALTPDARLWTRDRGLAAVAQQLGLGVEAGAAASPPAP